MTLAIDGNFFFEATAASPVLLIYTVAALLIFAVI